MRTFLAVLLLGTVLPCMAAQSPRTIQQRASAVADTAPMPRVVRMSGFRIDRSRVSADEWPAVQRRLERQIGIVLSAGVPDKVLAFFRRVPIEIHPQHNGRGGTYQRRLITLPAFPIPEDRPVLLHELLHAYHHQVLGDAAPIRKAYKTGLKSPHLGGRYPGTHFLDNETEYFAFIGSIYLFGRIQQPPFDCTAVATEQPEFLGFLARTFGPHECGGVAAASR